MTDTLLRNASLGELSANLSKMLRTFILSGKQSVGAMLPPAAKFAVSAQEKEAICYSTTAMYSQGDGS